MFSTPSIYGIPPIHQLTNDVLEEIFKAYQKLRVEEDGSPPIFRHTLLLSHVCKRWQDASVSFPSLWSWFTVVLIYPDTNYVSLLKLFLQRAGTHPLCFEFYEWHSTPMPDVKHTVLQLLFEKHDLWRNATFTFTDYPAHLLANINEGHFPILESILLNVDEAWTLEQRAHLWRVLHSSPAIHNVTLDDFCDSMTFYLDATPWHQLRFLDIHMPIAADVLVEALRSCERLEKFIFSGHLQYFRQSLHLVDIASPIILPQLQQMRLTFQESLSMEPSDPNIQDRAVEWLMASISTPSLTQFRLWSKRKLSPTPFVNFFRQSGCRIQYFKLCYDMEEKHHEATEWLKLSLES